MMRKLIIQVGLAIIIFFMAISISPAAMEPTEYRVNDSYNLVAWAWENYKKENYERAIRWSKICAYYWGEKALVQRNRHHLTDDYPQGSIAEVYRDFWALNDVGISYLIMAESWRKLGQATEAGSGTEAETAYRMLTDKNHGKGSFYFAQCASEPVKGEQFLWKPADVAYARLIGYTEEKFDNVGLMKAAWEELNKDREKARKFAKLCIDMYTERLPAQWAINDLGTCWFIIGEAWRMDGEQAKANKAYQEVIDDYPTSQCLDPGEDGKVGTTDDSYWSVAEAAKEKIR